MSDELLAASCRVALAGLLHDLGKFAERARLACAPERLETWKQLDCPHWDGRPSHIHAAYTTAGFMAIEHLLPRREQIMAAPFAGPNVPEADDSLINAAARHHRPETFLQWIIATADRLASGFERSEFERYNQAEEGTATGKNHYQARLLSLFEAITPDGPRRPESADFCLPLAPLSPATIFPARRREIEPNDNPQAQAEYAALWQGFIAALERIPASHRDNLPLWLDHFDAAWLAYTHAIPSATAGKTKPDVSLYDHSKAVAALAVALWRWHEAHGKVGAGETAALKAQSDWDVEKFLLIQGDFSGIQDFIFAEGGQTQKKAASILRGRSFQVSLLSELAALAVLEALSLPPTSQIVNAAGKFLIVAANTPQAREKIAEVKARLDAWFIEHTFGESGITLVSLPASSTDFTAQNFTALIERLFARLERAKLARFALVANEASPILESDFSQGACAFDGRRPAQTTIEGLPASLLAADQITIGKRLADPAYSRLLIARQEAELWASRLVTPLKLDYFGYRIAFARDEELAGRFGELAQKSELLRCWDMALPAQFDAPLFNGYARREINAFIPTGEHAAPIELDHIASQDEGVEALAVLKGDVDHLGAIFQRGIAPHTFARMASLSRQMNAFFAIHLPALCRQEFPYTYTVFAGGDDFFLIGPWHQTQSLARRMRQEFRRFEAENPTLTFSAGLVLVKPGFPIRQLAREAEARLDEAKGAGRDRLTSHGVIAPWPMIEKTAEFEQWLSERRTLDGFSTGFVYRLLKLAEMAASRRPEDAIWQAWLAYRVKRFVVDRLPKERRLTAQTEIAGALRNHLLTGKLAARIAIENHLYLHRERRTG
ncbi:MAG: type III-A CRISPR-associated protein Cas10/Csm1 [Rhodocyclaceae bacterium]|nr:type III-A CRISPR-associated protein Cas10/Csm1 [Rhodocyclaceae bacterium]